TVSFPSVPTRRSSDLLLVQLLQRTAPQCPEQPQSHPAHASPLRQRVAFRGTSRTSLLVPLERGFPPPSSVSVSFRPRTLRGGLRSEEHTSELQSRENL